MLVFMLTRGPVHRIAVDVIAERGLNGVIGERDQIVNPLCDQTIRWSSQPKVDSDTIAGGPAEPLDKCSRCRHRSSFGRRKQARTHRRSSRLHRIAGAVRSIAIAAVVRIIVVV